MGFCVSVWVRRDRRRSVSLSLWCVVGDQAILVFRPFFFIGSFCPFRLTSLDSHLSRHVLSRRYQIACVLFRVQVPAHVHGNFMILKLLLYTPHGL